jgi:hypothetical protein
LANFAPYMATITAIGEFFLKLLKSLFVHRKDCCK